MNELNTRGLFRDFRPHLTIGCLLEATETAVVLNTPPGLATGRHACTSGELQRYSPSTCGTITGDLPKSALGSSWISKAGSATASKLGPGNQAIVPTAWNLSVTMSGLLLSSKPLTIGFDIRCDNNVVASMGKGCVYPGVKPSLTLSKTGTASGVAVHVGKAISSGLPSTLTRTTPTLATKNRTKACPSSLMRDPGYECDEYPFASSTQGAASGGSARVPSGCRWTSVSGSGATGWSRCQVLKEQNHRGGTQLGDLYRNNRVLPGDQYVVRVVA